MSNTIIANLPLARTYRGLLVITPQDRDIGVMVPRRWEFLDKLLGPRFFYLKMGETLRATSDGRGWRVVK